MAAASRQPFFAAPPAIVLVRTSTCLISLLVLAHGAALVLVLFAEISIASLVKDFLCASLMLSLLLELRHLTGSQRIVKLMMHADGTLEVLRASGVQLSAQVLHDTTVTPWLTTLLLRFPQKDRGWLHRHQALIFFSDALEAEDSRNLRVWLRWRAASVA